MHLFRHSTFAAAIVAVMFASQAWAGPLVWDFEQSDPVSLQDLNDEYDGTLIVGDKKFDNFFISVAATTSNTVLPPDADSINIFGTQSGPDYGVSFNASWQVQPGELLDTLLQFKVTVLDPDLLVHDNSLGIDGFVNTTNYGSLSVSETVYREKRLGAGGQLDQDPIAIKQVFYVSPTNFDVFDHKLFTDPITGAEIALKEVWVVKDILLTGGAFIQGENDFGVVGLSSVSQTFSQIPEPASIALLGLGSLLIVRRRR